MSRNRDTSRPGLQQLAGALFLVMGVALIASPAAEAG